MKMQMTKEINCVVSEKPGAAGIDLAFPTSIPFTPSLPFPCTSRTGFLFCTLNARNSFRAFVLARRFPSKAASLGGLYVIQLFLSMSPQRWLSQPPQLKQLTLPVSLLLYPILFSSQPLSVSEILLSVIILPLQNESFLKEGILFCLPLCPRAQNGTWHKARAHEVFAY